MALNRLRKPLQRNALCRKTNSSQLFIDDMLNHLWSLFSRGKL